MASKKTVLQNERILIQERTLTGLAGARAPGKLGGRPKTLNAEKQ